MHSGAGKASQSANLFPLNASFRLILLIGWITVTNLRFAQSPGTKLWEVSVGNHVYSTPAIGPDGTIYVGVSSGDYSTSSSKRLGLCPHARSRYELGRARLTEPAAG